MGWHIVSEQTNVYVRIENEKANVPQPLFLALWGKDKEEFYIKHLAETRCTANCPGGLYVRGRQL